MISLANVSKRFGASVAVSDVTLSVAEGASRALVGSSGSGKSTLLRILTGLDRPDTGVVRVAGETVSDETLPRVRARIGYMIQDGGLFPHLSCRRNVTLLAERRAMPSAALHARLSQLTDLLRLAPTLLDRFPHELSGGQRQRVALMRALFRDPMVLLLDEPFGALDPLVRREIGDELFAALAPLHKTVLLVTHDVAEAAALTSEMTILRGGTVVQTGTLTQLRAAPSDPFVTQFLGAHRELGRPNEPPEMAS